MGLSSELIRRQRSQKVINNADDFVAAEPQTNDRSNGTESTESSPPWDRPYSKTRSRSESSRTMTTVTSVTTTTAAIAATRLNQSTEEQTDASDSDIQKRAGGLRSARKSNGIYPLREIEAFPSSVRRPRGRPPKKHNSIEKSLALQKPRTDTPPNDRQETTTPDVTLSDQDLQYMTYVQDQLRIHIEKIRQEHRYELVKALRRARIAIDKASTDGSKVAGYYDDVSPFKKMKPIAILGSTVDEDMDVSQYHTKLSIKHKERGLTSFGEKDLIYCPSIDIRSFKDFKPGDDQSTRLNLVPKYHIYTTLANNLMVEDDEVLRFQPYLGEEADEVNDPLLFEENYPLDITRYARENGQQREMVEWICDDISRLLTKFEISEKAISYYLLGDLKKVQGVNAKAMEKTRKRFFPPDHDPDYHKTKAELLQRKRNLRPVDASQLHKAELVCVALRDVVGIRAWWVLKAISNEGKHRTLQGLAQDGLPAILPTDNDPEATEREHKLAILSGGNPIPYQIDTYTKLHCQVCYMHQCPFHAPQDSDSDDDEKPPPREQGIYDGENANTYPAEANAPCSEYCFLKDESRHIIENESSLKPWSTAQKELLAQSLMILFDNARAACMLASVINRPCVEIYKAIQERRKTAEIREPRKQLEVQQVRNRKKRTGLLRVKKKTDILGYPRDCATNTQEALARPPHKGCDHEGVCSKENGCTCCRDQVMCEKTCKCESCIRKWRGCRCARRDIPCLPGQCECRKWNRECDADLCRTCGASETLDPVNRYNMELAKSCCGNVEAQRGIPKRTFIGLSNIQAAGLGLFIGENVKKDQFIGEYLGEIISEAEAERRGVLYDKRGVSFLFNLNKEQVVDAARAGNKLRFINHYYEPNCIARVVMTGVTHRIGMYALRDLYAGEELYFDYGYNEKTSNFVQAEPEFKFEPPVAIERPKKTSKTTLSRKTKRLKIKGKLQGPGKKRLRAATKQTTTAASVVPQKRARGRPRKSPLEMSLDQSSTRTTSRRRIDYSSSSEEEEDYQSDSEGSVIEIKTADQLDATTDEDSDVGQEVYNAGEPVAIPDSEEDDDYHEDSKGEEESSKSEDEDSASSDDDIPQVSDSQRKRRRLYSPLSRRTRGY